MSGWPIEEDTDPHYAVAMESDDSPTKLDGSHMVARELAHWTILEEHSISVDGKLDHIGVQAKRAADAEVLAAEIMGRALPVARWFVVVVAVLGLGALGLLGVHVLGQLWLSS